MTVDRILHHVCIQLPILLAFSWQGACCPRRVSSNCRRSVDFSLISVAPPSNQSLSMVI